MKSNRLSQFADAMGISGEVMRRLLALLLWSVWFGGFTFYAAVVIHNGGPKVFGGHREIGFLTQEITHWLNLIGVVTLLVLMWNCLASWPEDRPLLCWGMGASWVVMVATLVALFSMHATLDLMVDAGSRTILDKARFHPLHETYESLATTQWAAALVHLWCMVAAWRHLDRAGKRTKDT